LISGGFAARIYGSVRELADIDIVIPEINFDEILSEVKECVTFGPAQYKDENWDLWLMTLCYKEQEIDICGAHEAQIYDKKCEEWVWLETNFSISDTKEIFGIEVPVVPKDELITNKSKLRREVDLLDIADIISPTLYLLLSDPLTNSLEGIQ
jgi:hypothetical protein